MHRKFNNNVTVLINSYSNPNDPDEFSAYLAFINVFIINLVKIKCLSKR